MECRKCGLDLPADRFAKNRRQCKSCRRKVPSQRYHKKFSAASGNHRRRYADVSCVHATGAQLRAVWEMTDRCHYCGGERTEFTLSLPYLFIKSVSVLFVCEFDK